MNSFLITATGGDRPGLVAEITRVITQAKGNIVDIEAFSMRGLFAIFMITEFQVSATYTEKLKNQLQEIGHKVGLDVVIEPYIAGRRKSSKKLILVTTIGKDRPGIVAEISSFLFENNVNMERIRMIAYGELNAMEILIDISDLSSDFEAFREGLKNSCSIVGQDVVLQTEAVFRRPKKLIVFDVDNTLIEAEVIDELAKAAGVGEKVKEITEKAMNGEIDFEKSLVDRAKLLKGLDLKTLEEIANNLEITQSAEELVNALRTLGYKTALVSGGFKYFVDKIKERLGIDYAYANTLVIKDGRLTGEVKKPIIDEREKGRIIHQLAKKENIMKEEIVAVGDGANDRFMLRNSGLGIALNPKEALRKIADGVMTRENLVGLLYCLGAPEEKLKEFSSRTTKT